MSAQFTFLKEVGITDDPKQLVAYANIATASSTAEEFILHFGLRNPDDPNVGIGVAKVYLSLPHAKRLALALAQVVKGYEETFGEIATDPLSRLTPEARSRIEVKEKPKGGQNG